MKVTERLPREKARDYAVRVLRDNIISLDLEPGAKVTETELGAQLGLSRTPVREALVELANYGIVEIYPQNGIVISKIDFHSIDEACFLRQGLETLAIQQVCDVATVADIGDLENIIEVQRTFLENKNPGMLLKMDNTFHRRLFQICNKLMSYNLMQNMLVHFDRLRQLRLITIKEVVIVEDHQAMLDAITARDKAAASGIMTVHLNRYKSFMHSVGTKFPHLIKQ